MINMDQSPTVAVEGMIQFLYTGDYILKGKNKGKARSIPENESLTDNDLDMMA